MMKDVIENVIPFNRYLGIQALTIERGRVILALPFRPEFIGDPTRPAIHGGVISTLMDAAGGAATFTELEAGDRISTVDLLVDYLLPAAPKSLEAEARVVRTGNRVSVVQISIKQEGSSEIIAQGRAVYNIVRNRHRESRK